MAKEETAVTQEEPRKNRLLERYKKNRPDLDWETEGVDNDIEGLAADELDKYDADAAANKEMNDKMNNLFGSDSRAAKIFVDWANGQDPIENLLELYGEDFVDALQSKEGKDKFKEALEKWRKGKQADEEHRKAYDANIETTAKNLVAFADKHNISDDELEGIVAKAHELGSSVCEGLYPDELLEMILKAKNYDTAVADAKNEGYAEGREQSVRRELRQSKPATGLPPTSGTQNGVAVEVPPQKPRTGTLDAFGGIKVTRRK